MLRIASEGVFKRNSKFIPLISNNTQNYSTETKLPSQADVVIIGGGSLGCNTLYQLTKRGVNAVLVERSKITSGTTWHTSGLLWRLRPSDVEIQLLTATTKLMESLQQETGADPGYVKNGGLFISRTEERLKEYKRLNTLGHYFGIESHIIPPAEAVKLHPLLNAQNFTAALYCPSDGCLDPSMLCAALIKGATAKGGKLIEKCPVTKILTETTGNIHKVAGVETTQGTIKTKCVVNAAGVWSRQIAQMVGLDLPLSPLKHAYVIMESIPEVKGTPNVRDHDYSVYFRTQGDKLYIGGYEMNPEILKEVPSDFEFSLYDLDFKIFGVHMEKAAELCPIVNKVGMKSTVCGPESFTPDHKPLMGEDPRLMGLFHACGMNSAGMMLGSGCAEQLAIWITKGNPELHMFSYDIRRFSPSMRKNRAFITESSQEAYSKNYSIVFPHDQPLAGRNFKISSFHEALVANGAIMEQAQGWERPGFYIKDSTAPVRGYDWYGYYDHALNPDKRYKQQLMGDLTFNFSKHHDLIGEEALACRTNSALFDMSYFRKLYLTGPDAQQAADWLFTADTDKNLEKVTYTCALNKQGGCEADLTVVPLNQGVGTLVGPILKGKGYYLVAGGASGYYTLAHLRKEIKLKRFKAVVTDVTDKLGILSIQGPKSGEILQAVTEFPITDEKLPFRMSQIITIAGQTCRVMRVSFIGELGYELHIPFASTIAIYNKVVDAGKSFGMKFAGYRALYSLSCEKGFHLWNSDLRSNDNPVEANLGRFCRKVGSYQGKDRVDKAKAEGVKKLRAFIMINERIPLWGNETIWRDNVVVGFLRRAEYAYFLKSSIGIGYVAHPEGSNINKDFLTTGTYEIEVMGKKYPAIVHAESPFDPKNQRLAGYYEHQLKEDIEFED